MKFNYNYTRNFIDQHEIEAIKPFVELSRKILEEKTGAGNDFLGWENLPFDYDKEEFEKIKLAAKKLEVNLKH